MNRHLIIIILITLVLTVGVFLIASHHNHKQCAPSNIYAPDVSQNTLFAAADDCNINRLVDLYWAGSDFSVRNSNGETILDVAKRRGDRHCNLVISVLMLHYYCRDGNIAGVKALLQHGIDPNIRIKELPEQTPMRTAIFANKKNVVAFLVKNGASLHALPSLLDHNMIEPPIIIAALQGRVSIVEELLKLGANIQEPGANGLTALHAAAYRGYGNVIKLLLDYGANPNVKDKKGRTPLHVAAGSRVKPEVFKILVDAGGNIKAKTNCGLTPIDVAKDRHMESNCLQLVKLKAAGTVKQSRR